MRAAELARALGAKKSGRQWACRCPAHDDKEPSLIFWDGETAIRFKCYSGCEPVEIIAALRRRGLWHEPKREKADHTEFARQIWHEARALDGTAAEFYLAQRKLRLPGECNGRVARFHPNCPRGRDRVPALVVLFRTIFDNVGCAIQRIFISPEYLKDGKPMMLGPVQSAAMKLGPRADKLTICEGFETALALHMLGYGPVWALGSAGAIERFPVIAGIEELIVGVDNDDVGKAAATVVLHRWGERARGIMVNVEGEDFADIFDRPSEAK